MAMLGKCLVFYLKYPHEMSRLYASDEPPNLEGMESPERIIQMAQTVGEAACREVADFLEACATRIEEHYQALCSAKRNTRRAGMESKWWMGVRFTSPKVPDQEFFLGVGVWVEGIIVPWIWRAGGRRVEQGLRQILGPRAHSGTEGGLVRDTGCLALARIQILPEGHEGFDVHQEPLIEQVGRACNCLTKDDVKAILRL